MSAPEADRGREGDPPDDAVADTGESGEEVSLWSQLGGRKVKVGGRPGMEGVSGRDRPPEPGTVTVTCVDFGPRKIEVNEVESLEDLLAAPRPDWAKVRWLNVDGLHPFVVDRLRKHYDFHTLAAEDTLNVPQRPKVDVYEKHLFIVLRMVREDEGGGFLTEQVSCMLQEGLVVTFQERFGDVWNPVRVRLKKSTSRLRNSGADYLVYALIDAVVDHFFPLLERYGERLEALEVEVLERAGDRTQVAIQGAKRELMQLRKVMWPVREMTANLQRADSEFITPEVRPYLLDVYDHAVQVIDIIETYRELAGGLHDLYLSAISNRMNEVMKVLTIMASFFIPITFVAGVYGMNFEHIPELAWRYSYAVFWGVCLTISGGLLYYFRSKRWIGGG